MEFGHEFNGIVATPRTWTRRNPDADPVMARYSQKLLAPALTHSARFTDRVRQLVVLPRGLCRVEVWRSTWASTGARCTTAAGRGHQLQRVARGERRALASRHVDSTDRLLTEVAALLGFTAPSAFSRWYRGSFGGSATQRALSR